MKAPRRVGPSEELVERCQELSSATLVLLLDAYREGFLMGKARAQARHVADIDAALRDLESVMNGLDAEGCARLEENFADAKPTPLASAYIGKAADVLWLLRSQAVGT